MIETASLKNDDFKIKFWGTRGTRALCSADNNRYGSKTICVEVQCGNRVLVFDAGTGFVDFGKEFLNRKSSLHFDLFFSHAHYDHVEGIPHFQPFYDKKVSCDVWAGQLKGVETTREIFDFLMMEPYFPVSIEKFQAAIQFHKIAPHQSVDLGDGITVHTTRLHHPGGANGYRVEYGGKSFGFITDTTHAIGKQDLDIVSFINDIDLFVYDSGYTDAEFPEYSSFGHSTWQEALRLKKTANAKHVLGFHHMPFRMDSELDEIEAEMNKASSLSGLAKDGSVYEL